jgi:tetratricopeptide (TPR) repeat protein
MVLSREPLRVFLIYRPEESGAQILYGHASLADGDVEAALEAYTRALALDSSLVEAYLSRAQVRLDQDDPEAWGAALDDYMEASRLSPDSFPAGLGMARAWLKMGNLEEAYEQIQRAADLAESEEQVAAVYYWRAVALEDLNRLPEALADWEALLALPQEVVPASWWAEAQTRFEPTATVTPSETNTPTVTSTPEVTATSAVTRTATPPPGTPIPTRTKAVTPTSSP